MVSTRETAVPHAQITVVGERDRQRPKRRRDRTFSVVFGLLCVGLAVGSPLPYLLIGIDTMAETGGGLADYYSDKSSFVRGSLLTHVAFSGIALFLAPLQVSTLVRRRWPVAHRISGRVSAAAIVVGAISGFVLASVSYAGWSGRVGFSLMSVLWLGCTYKSIAEARRGDLAAHGRWALRVIALTFAAVTLRLWLLGYIAVALSVSDSDFEQAFDQIYVVLPFLSWIPNLLFVEWHLRRSKRQRSSRELLRSSAT